MATPAGCHLAQTRPPAPPQLLPQLPPQLPQLPLGFGVPFPPEANAGPEPSAGTEAGADLVVLRPATLRVTLQIRDLAQASAPLPSQATLCRCAVLGLSMCWCWVLPYTSVDCTV